jgi:hypothetical protein
MRMTQRERELRREARYHGQAAAEHLMRSIYFGLEALGEDAHALREEERAYKSARLAARFALLSIGEHDPMKGG